MKLLLDSFWRALAYLFMPRVIGLSLLPLLVAGGVTLGLAYLFWTDAVTAVRATLESWSLVEALLRWVESFLGPQFRAVVAPLLVVAMVVPLVIVLSLLLVAFMATPAIVSLVAQRRFGDLERRHGGTALKGALSSLGYTALALVMVVLTMPLWLIPGVALLLPPLIWGWLTMKVMAFDVLADHASGAERRSLMAQHAWPLLLIGLVTGFLGAAPTVIWALGAMTLIVAPLLLAVSVWLYTVVFMFSALWFAHYALGALQVHRLATQVEVVDLGSAAAPSSATPAPLLPTDPALGS